MHKRHSGGSTNEFLSVTYSVSDLYRFVKQYDEEFSPKPVKPVLLNENGTPKVFYHGTDKDFTVFDTASGEYWFSESYDYAEAMMEERGGQR